MTSPSLVAKSFNIPVKSLRRWLRHGSERKKGKLYHYNHLLINYLQVKIFQYFIKPKKYR